MTLLDAKPFDAERHGRRRKTARIIGVSVIVVLILVLVGIVYWPRYQARRTVDAFFHALEQKNYQEAYYIWKPVPKLYPMDAFMRDWGPDSRWGIIKTYHIDQVGLPPPAGGGSGGHASGLVALVTINHIVSDQARIWIQNRTRELSFYQF
ncbi:MAG: hypothetical protein ACRD01_10490 [Terriglobales bacterium]